MIADARPTKETDAADSYCASQPVAAIREATYRALCDKLERERDEAREAGDEVARRLQDALGSLDDAPAKPTSHWAESFRDNLRPRIVRALERYQTAREGGV